NGWRRAWLEAYSGRSHRLDSEGFIMLRNTKVQMTLVLAIGVLGGYALASGKLNFFPQSQASAPGAGLTEGKGAGDCNGCCTDGMSRQQLVAMADPNVQAAAAKVQANGKKPNIVFIMGDDIGM